MFPEGLIVSISGIRGRVGVDLTPDRVARFAAAFGSYVQGQGWGRDLVLARDSRPSGPALLDAAAAGLASVGCRVCDLGLVPTPTALLEIEERGLGGGIVISASHNPREWNALKLASSEGAFLTPEQGSEFLAGLREGRPPGYSDWDGFGARDQVTGSVDRHIERILALDLIDQEAIAARSISVAVDAARGAGGVILPGLLERLGCRVVEVEFEPDGRFTRDPEPVARNLERLCEVVRREGAQLGMAVDPDVDRLALVDGRGRAIGEDYTLALAARLVLSHRPGPVVTNLSTSQIVEEVTARAGVELYRAPVGEAHVAVAMRERAAVIGGEGNGGVILPALHHTRDAPLAMALILQLLAEGDAGIGEIVAEYPQFHIVKDRVPRSELELDRLAGDIQKSFPNAEVDRRDGLYLRWASESLWLHIRPSGTEPIVRLIAEGLESDEARILELIEVSKRIIQEGGGA